jgi:hypothetical protein
MGLLDMTDQSLEELRLSPITPPPPAPGASGPFATQLESSTALPTLAKGLRPLAHTPTLILVVQSDVLFPVE